ncbi:predicted protein [Streptomyces viridochromogenes DSM 40736]|uniref:Predicted protein n=1 Tax=Streptomyces viridochromogenes (strain DSM 40736 / JCM 4977 / BCRC 1201 / Tue 494) TaxID=591159 RepID=D9XAR8_STRVT|nr:hypothetical protein [Streptomyces viridochromogenes]EFL32230.1 predicted protein [Streptomyces viridochromogenes DSM 40736]
MLNSRKIAAVAGLLGSFALIGVGAAQATTDGDPGKCVEDGNGQVRCVDLSQYTYTTENGNKVTVVNNSTQDCPTSHSQVSCVSDTVVSGKKA